jgi:phosphate acetyltransferase
MGGLDHPYVRFLIERAAKSGARIAIPDAAFDARYLTAALEVRRQGWLNPILTGPREAIQAAAAREGLELADITIVDPGEHGGISSMIDEYAVLRAKEGLSREQIEAVVRDPAAFSCMLLRHGEIDGICSGVHYSTADLARPAIRILGMQEGFTKMTALAVILFDSTPLGDNLVYACADGTILPRPTSEELAEIAILAADRAKALLPDPPRVAMLSFSTLGSAKHEEVDRVVRALEIARGRRPDLAIDGEFQLDTAISPYVAARKVKRPSQVAGRANVLIWPDIQSGNIAGKGMMLMGNGRLAGATFLGIRGLVTDHSRGATVEECIVNIAFTATQAERSQE